MFQIVGTLPMGIKQIYSAEKEREGGNLTGNILPVPATSSDTILVYCKVFYGFLVGRYIRFRTQGFLL